MYVDATIKITTQMTQPHMRYYSEDKDMSVWELNVCANAVMHACVCACFKFACVQQRYTVNAFLVGRINALGRINGGPLEAIEHACQTLEVDDMHGAKLEELSSGPLEINHI